MNSKHLSEQAVQQATLYQAPKEGMFLGRNNSGAFTANISLPPGVPKTAQNILAAIKKKYQGLRWGWNNTSQKFSEVFKSPDLIGWTEITITPNMVGKKIAVFTGLEVKHPGFKMSTNKHVLAQKNCLDKIESSNGIGSFITDESQLRDNINRFVRKMEE